MLSKPKVIFLLIAILGIAVFFRFYKITQTPPGLYPDEAVNGVNALDALSQNNWKVFYPENNGREGLFMNIQSVSVKYFGAYPWSLRVVSGVFGVLTVLGLFLLTRLLWSPAVALLASYLVAVSFWPVNFSRIGFRAVMLPFILVWSFYFLWSGLRKRSFGRIILAGLIYGAGMHTYISWRVSPLLLILMFLILLFGKEFNRKFLAKAGLVFFACSIIVASPLLIYYAKNPANFMGRAAQVSIFNSGSPVKALLGSAVKTIGMFNIYGDGNWRHNLSGRPGLFWPLGIGFLIGILIALRRFSSSRNWFLILWLLIMLLPNFLAPEGAPHALRALGAMPAVFILSALGLNLAYAKIKEWFGGTERIKKEIAVLAGLFIIFVGLWEYRTYFVVWAARPEVSSNFEQRLTDIGNYLNYTDSETKKYVVVNENGTIVKSVSIQAQPIMFLAYDKNIVYLNPQDIPNLPKTLSNAVIIPTKSEPEIINQITQKYPLSHVIDFITFKAMKIPAPFIELK